MTGRWITNHDPEEYVYTNWTECVECVLDNREFVNTNLPTGYTYKPWKVPELMKAIDDHASIEDEGDWN